VGSDDTSFSYCGGADLLDDSDLGADGVRKAAVSP
jgi:hypothetical protein